MDKVIFRAEDLQAIDNVLYEPKRSELTARTVINLKTDVSPGAEQVGYNVMNRSGVAKIMGNKSNDLPLVTADVSREFVKIYTIAVGFEYGLQEMRAAQLTGTTVDSLKAGIARRAIAEKENKLAWIGDADYNIKGITNAAGIQTTAVPVGAAGGATSRWVTKISAEIVEDIRKVRAKVAVLPGHGDVSNLVLMVPADQYEELNRRYSDVDARSILAVIRANDWFSSIVKVTDLKGAGAAGSDCFIVADTSREVMELIVPMDITRLQEEWKYPNWKVPVEERCGGVIIRYPMAISRGDGI